MSWTVVLRPVGAEASAPRSARELRNQGIPDGALTVGVWDLGVQAGFLSRLLRTLNKAQAAFAFVEVIAAVPGGLTSNRERVVEWVSSHRKTPLSEAELQSISHAVIDEDFFPRAERVRDGTDLDYLCGLTPNPLVGYEEEAGEPYWDYFGSWDGSSRSILVSTADLRELVWQANRTFEMVAGYLMVGQLLIALHYKNGLETHREGRNCLFDYRYDRTELVEDVRRPWIEEDCLKRIGPEHREPAMRLMDALDTYRPERS